MEIGDPGNGLEVTSGVDGGEALIISPLDPGDDRNSVRHVVADTQEPLRQVPGVYRVALESAWGVKLTQIWLAPPFMPAAAACAIRWSVRMLRRRESASPRPAGGLQAVGSEAEHPCPDRSASKQSGCGSY